MKNLFVFKVYYNGDDAVHIMLIAAENEADARKNLSADMRVVDLLEEIDWQSLEDGYTPLYTLYSI